MKQFQSIEKLDTGILYALELASSLSVLLLAFGLIASMANVLTKGSVLSNSPFMQQVWAWTQCIAIDASVPGVILRTFSYKDKGDKVKFWLYVALSILLLFTAAIVSNIESVQQTLNLTLDAAYGHVFIPVEGLIWVRSIVLVLLIVCHALRHVQIASPTKNALEAVPQKKQGKAQSDTTATETKEEVKALPVPKTRQGDNYKRVEAYLKHHSEAKVSEVSKALHISIPTARKWIAEVRGSTEQAEAS